MLTPFLRKRGRALGMLLESPMLVVSRRLRDKLKQRIIFVVLPCTYLGVSAAIFSFSLSSQKNGKFLPVCVVKTSYVPRAHTFRGRSIRVTNHQR